MKKQGTVVAAFLFLFISVFLVGCPDNRVSPPQPDPNEQMQPLSKKLTVDFYLDGTLSMMGFVTPGDFTNYVKTLQSLESVAIGSWPDGQVEFSKFGSHIVPFEGREYLNGVRSDFYTDQDIQQTHIETVIESANKNNLTVIVTDLFQNEADATLLIKKLTNRYIKDNLAVGILGIRSEFSGRVYDIGINHYCFDYNSGLDDPERFRPFYLVMLGKHADIAHYFEELKRNSLERSSKCRFEFVIFSPYIVNPLPAFAGARIESITKLVEVNSILRPSDRDYRLRQFCLRGPQGSFKVVLKYNLLPNTLAFDNTKLEIVTDASKVKPDSLTTINDAVEINWDQGDDQISIDSKFLSAGWPGAGVYLFDITLRPQLTAYNIPSWFSEWDMNDTNISENNGATTLNLYKFLTSLWQANWQTHKPKVAHLYCYVEKK
jgi:hypothetical protein